ncbi:Oidioi.mRNA.OKI2018_I69.chr2.g8031.t1.cds [Oikopleura dioica]|uniref:Oidioi.mRNA.OKI2018_I69.chr2.g8031.t1.cds n=1 Tax=Oikopleura dioica TaxID=34765 RepID=A0ABN7TB98_OIKDI|nr:Oidioi.mRNA.OKI2018_I69.chr2.g8031.t1.cds [Oikopleura dioica]
MDLLLNLLRSEPSKNLVLSSINVEHAFAILATAAAGKTRDEILKMTSQEVAKTAQRVKSLEALSTVQLDSKMFTCFKPKTDFWKAHFTASHDYVDFTDPKTADEINSWIAKSTKNMIKKLVDASDLDALTRMILVSAIFFKGSWQTPFRRTFEGKFDGGKHTVQYMRHNFKGVMYNQTGQFQAISLPYSSDGLEMTVVLPKSDLLSFETSLTGGKIKEVFAGLRKTREVNFQMPKFAIESELDLKNIFEKLGFGHVFSSAMDDYSPLTDESVFLSMAKHKAKIEVNEEGTVAAAATVAKIMLKCMVIPEEFVCDRPFLYFIRKEDEVIFAGRFMQP